MHPKNPPFQLLHERDFGEVLNDTINFVKQYGRPLYKALIYVVLPLSLLYGIFLGLFAVDTGNIFQEMINQSGGGMASPLGIFSSWSYWGAILIALIESLLITIVVYSFFKLQASDEEDLSINRIWQEAKKRILPVLGTMITLGIFVMLVFWAIAFVAGILMIGVSNISGGPFLIFLLAIALLFGISVLATFVSMTIPAAVIENKGPIESIQRSISLVSGNWGQTLLLLIVIYMVIGVVSLVFSMPAAIIQWFVTFNSVEPTIETSSAVTTIALIAGNCISTIGNALLTPILHVCLGIQFFSLIEKKEGTGIQSRIDSFGNRLEDDFDEQY